MRDQIWGTKLLGNYSLEETNYFESVPKDLPDINWLWSQMDIIWDSCNLNNKKPLINQEERVGRFYSHPIWLLNGIFTGIDKTSVKHREYIAKRISELRVQNIADFGGGSGALAISIVERSPDLRIDIIEPFPIEHFKRNLESYKNLSIKRDLINQFYNCIVTQDVLEHVDDPLSQAYFLANSLKDNGFIIFANCFYPVIKCHLPSSFYLRYTFKISMQLMGLKFIEKVPGAEYALIFQKIDKLKPNRLKLFIPLLKLVGNSLNHLIGFAQKLRYIFLVR